MQWITQKRQPSIDIRPARSHHRSFAWLRLTLLAAMLVIGGVAMDAQACPNCKDAVADTASGAGTGPGSQSGAPSELADGYNYSILFMIGMMYAVVGGSGLLLWHAVKKHAPSDKVLMGID